MTSRFFFRKKLNFIGHVVTSRRKNGFNLIEVLVYVALLIIIIVPIFSFVIWSISANTKAKTMREVLNGARKAMEAITREVREARVIYDPTTTPNQLSLETRKYLPTGEEISYIDFYLCGEQLCSRKDGRDPVVLTPVNVRITNLNFTKIVTGQDSAVQINIQADYQNPSNRPEYQSSVSLTSTASLRPN